MSDAKPPSLWGAMEASSRPATRSVGVGLIAYVGWSWWLGHVLPLIAVHSEDDWPHPWLIIGLGVVQGGWALLVLPALSWGLARLTSVQPWSHAVTAVGVGAATEISLRSAMGLEVLPGDLLDLVVRASALVAGVGLSAFAARRGAQAGDGRDARVAEVVAANRAAYTAMTAPERSASDGEPIKRS